MPEQRVAAVILAAGASTRLGEPKQMVRLDPEQSAECLLERAVRIARGAGCVPVVVLGCWSDLIVQATELGGAEVVLNAEWREGMGASVRVGVQAVRDWASAVVLMACDQPAVTAEHLQRLMLDGVVACSTYAGRRGVPAFFPASSFNQLMQMRGDAGARDLLGAARPVELSCGELDVDTAESLHAARERYAHGAA